MSSPGLLNFTLLSPSGGAGSGVTTHYMATVPPRLHSYARNSVGETTTGTLERCSRENSNNIFLSSSCYVGSRKYFPHVHLATGSGVGGCKMKVGFRVQFHLPILYWHDASEEMKQG